MDYHSKAPWHEAAIEDLENTSMSYEEIARKYGRSRNTIIRLKDFYNLTRKNPARPRGLRKVEEKRSLSPQHRALGSRLTVWRGSRTYTEVADLLGVSAYAVRHMEVGAFDIPLYTLIRISEVMGIEIGELVKPFDRIHVERPTKETRP